MKRRSFVYSFLTVLLLIITAFSACITFIHKEDCNHSVCQHCEEIAVYEALEEHEDCMEISCETCVVLAKQIEHIEEQQLAEHSCHKVICETCAREALNRRLRVIFYTLIAFSILYAFLCATHWIVLEETLFEKAFTLSRLKVRLNN